MASQPLPDYLIVIAEFEEGWWDPNNPIVVAAYNEYLARLEILAAATKETNSVKNVSETSQVPPPENLNNK